MALEDGASGLTVGPQGLKVFGSEFRQMCEVKCVALFEYVACVLGVHFLWCVEVEGSTASLCFPLGGQPPVTAPARL